VLQILKLDHLDYVLSFLRMKLDRFDSMAEEQDARESEVEEQTGGSSIEVVTSGGGIISPLPWCSRQGRKSPFKAHRDYQIFSPQPSPHARNLLE